MFVKNLLHSGDLLSLVPVGLEVTLIYDEEGHLQRILKGYEEGGKDISADILPAVRDSQLVPLQISIKRGTTLVKGVFCLSDIVFVSGRLDDVSDDAIKLAINTGSTVNFYAGNVSSFATAFRGGNPIRQWLKLAGFNLLSSYVVPAQISQDIFDSFVARDTICKHKVYSSYMIYRGNQFVVYSLGLRSAVVTDVTMYQSIGGFFRGFVLADNKELDISWTQVVRDNIHIGSLIIIDNTNTIVKCVNSGVCFNKNSLSNHIITEHSSEVVSCPFCHKLIRVPLSGQFICDDPQCISHRYLDVLHFLENFNLPTISYDRYLEIAKNLGSLFCVLDLFDVEEYKDCRVSASLPIIIDAMIPSSLHVDFEILQTLCNECNNVVSTIEYYLRNPDRIPIELHTDAELSANLIAWLSDVANAAEVTDALHHKNITIMYQDRKFQGLPLLRNDCICLTGKFAHGTHNEVAAILRSYSAQILDDVDTSTTWLIIGDLQEGTDARKVAKAHENNVKVISESDFFRRYDIDSDLSQDL